MLGPCDVLNKTRTMGNSNDVSNAQLRLDMAVELTRLIPIFISCGLLRVSSPLLHELEEMPHIFLDIINGP